MVEEIVSNPFEGDAELNKDRTVACATTRQNLRDAADQHIVESNA